MMFASPLFLWALAGLVALGAVYFLKIRPRKKPVTAFFLWHAVLEEKPSDKLWRKLRGLWGLLLTALAFTAIVMALARPQSADAGRDLILILDASASMGAQVGGRSQLETAKETARKLIEGLDGTQRCGLISVAAQAQIHCHRSNDSKTLLKALESITVRDQGLATQSLEPLLATSDPKAERWIFLSDGAWPDANPDPRLECVVVGKPIPFNHAIVAADATLAVGDTPGVTFFLATVSTQTGPVKGEVAVEQSLDGQDKLVAVVPITLGAGKQPPLITTVAGLGPGRYRLKLSPSDQMMVDNQVELMVGPPVPIPLAIQAQNPYFFDRCVAAFSQSRSQSLALVADPAQAAVTLALGSDPGTPRAIVFAPSGESPCWHKADRPLGSVARAVDAAHPMLRHLNPEHLPWQSATPMLAPKNRHALVVDEGQEPLFYIATVPGRRVVVINCDPIASGLVLSPAFPVLIHDAALHLAEKENTVFSCQSTVAGFSLPLAGTATLRGPDGLHIEAQGHSGPLPKAGWWQISSSASTAMISTALFDSLESLSSVKPIPSRHEALSSGAPWWWILAILALTLLILEEILYHRRKVL